MFDQITNAASTPTQASEPQAARAKPLNAKTLAALPTGLQVWADQIEYLNEALGDNARRGYTLPARLREQFTTQRDELVRAREWLESVVAVRGGEA